MTMKIKFIIFNIAIHQALQRHYHNYSVWRYSVLDIVTFVTKCVFIKLSRKHNVLYIAASSSLLLLLLMH